MERFDLKSQPDEQPAVKKTPAPRRRPMRDFSFSIPETEKTPDTKPDMPPKITPVAVPDTTPDTAPEKVPDDLFLTEPVAPIEEEALPEKEPDKLFEVEAHEEAAPEEVLPEKEPDRLLESEAEEEAAPEAPAEEPKSEAPLSGAANLFDWIKSFLFSLTAVIFVFTLLFRGVTVSGSSMVPTLEDSEYLIISNLFYQPKTGDIVVVQSPHYKNGSEPLIKRVIATGNQTVKINFRTWQVWVDGVELEEDYIAYEPEYLMNPEDMEINEDKETEFVVEENCVFVMGDHRNDSMDSRSNAVGQIDARYIMGHVIFRVTPISKIGRVS